MKDKKKQ
ncbi:motA/TolQ/ExbB proton channel family protein, partial [Vibrio parahaemolyticus V-223/04]